MDTPPPPPGFNGAYVREYSIKTTLAINVENNLVVASLVSRCFLMRDMPYLIHDTRYLPSERPDFSQKGLPAAAESWPPTSDNHVYVKFNESRQSGRAHFAY